MEENIIKIEEPKKENKSNKKVLLFILIILIVFAGVGVAIYFLVIKEDKKESTETTTTTRRKIDGIPNSLEEYIEWTKGAPDDLVKILNGNYKFTDLYVPYEDIYDTVCDKTRTIEGHKTYATCNELCVTGEEGCTVSFVIDDSIKFDDTTDGCTGHHYILNKDKNFVIMWTGACAAGLENVTIYAKGKELQFGADGKDILKVYDDFNGEYKYRPFIKDNKLFMVLATPTPNNGHENDAPAKCRIVGVKLDDPYFNMDSSDYFDCTIEYGMS